MQGKLTLESMRWVIALLALCACGVGFIVYQALPLPNFRLAGIFLLAIGGLNLLFFKRIGSNFYAKAQSSPSCLARFWLRVGEKETQFFFLGLEIIIAAAGCILIFWGAA
jgi:hypothetical protein